MTGGNVPPEVQQHVEQMLDTHLRNWVHLSIPALGDRTPLEAVKEGDGREMVRALLDDMERREQDLGMGIKQQAYIDRARQQLGLQSWQALPGAAVGAMSLRRIPTGTRSDAGGCGWRSTGMVSRESRDVTNGVLAALPREETPAMAHRAPAWMENLVEVISECVEAQSPMGPLGYRSLAQGDPWELMVYPTPVELVGGADDGAVVIPGFSLDLQALLAYFDRVEAFQWYPSGLGPYDTEGPCVSIEGLYQGHDVWLRLLAGPPEDEEPGLQLASGSPP